MILFIALFAAMVPSALNKWANDASPIRSVDPVDATIVDGEVETPHMIGSEVSVEEQQRQDGTTTYRLLND
ncbi:hypothetical protein NKJ74_09515 [Mesorhizobium sp. M0046]|uniref:hypothetical protein n=1 Tax=Mesorhizobium sp. M0046 TaxID=2956858 RepID=UPI003338391D